jgi:hypothetical protein
MQITETPSSYKSLKAIPSASTLVTAPTSPAATADTLHRLVLLQLRLGYTADTSGVEICLFRLDTAQAAELETC